MGTQGSVLRFGGAHGAPCDGGMWGSLGLHGERVLFLGTGAMLMGGAKSVWVKTCG